MKNIDKAIIVWRWEDAPKPYRAKSEHGGDEDWVAFVPDAMELYDRVGWLSVPCFSNKVSRYKVRDGWVYIGAHA